MAGTELEFIVFRDTYEQAAAKRYRDLTPANQYNVDYSILGTARVEPLLRRIRNGMAGAGLYVESAKGECNLGQHEIAFQYADALSTCDNHSIYKTGAKEIAAQEGMSITFMAKSNEREGNSCHIHLSLRGQDGAPVMAGDGPHGLSELGEHFLAGQLARDARAHALLRPEHQLLQAVRAGQLRADRDPLGPRQPHLRAAPGRPRPVAAGGEPRARRRRQPLPRRRRDDRGGPGRHRAGAAAGAAPSGATPTLDTGARVPHTLREALELWEKSDLAREAFGDEVVDHYANNARVELAAFDAAVTDWELQRGFERL